MKTRNRYLHFNSTVLIRPETPSQLLVRPGLGQEQENSVFCGFDSLHVNTPDFFVQNKFLCLLPVVLLDAVPNVNAILLVNDEEAVHAAQQLHSQPANPRLQ
jgi:hypothetical protein